ncbi:MAG: hypothetical protein GKR89_15785 [Candidatus Latescibacteria bacterium]|nr:hypothetical protein [Candidatus Latescibacterota bacterium]
MRPKILEWIGLIMADQLAFLVVAVSFLYTFTEPVQKVKQHSQVQATIQAQKRQMQQLENQLEVLQKRLAGKTKSPKQPAAGNQVYLRLFPGELIVLSQGSREPIRVERAGLEKKLHALQRAGKKELDVVLSAEVGVAYDQLTELAENLMEADGLSVRFGW